jgi:hypothetical protein
MRSYTPDELRALTVDFDSYHWESGEAPGRSPVPVTYLIGYPKNRP